MSVFATILLAYFWICSSILALVHHEKLLNDIAQMTKFVNNVDNETELLSSIKTEIELLHPNAIAFNKHKYSENEYRFDETIDCVFNLFDLTQQIQQLMPIIANKLELKYDETVQKKLYKAIESSIYILCESPDNNIDNTDGFVEWVIMQDKKRRANIEGIIVKKMKKAFKLKLNKKQKKKFKKERHGQLLYNKCLKKLKPNLIKKLYQKLRNKYPTQRDMLDMISGIFMYSCARKYATNEAVKAFMKILVSMDDSDMLFNYLANNMQPYLESSKDNNECLQKASHLSYSLEVFILEKHSEFKKYPVFNAMNGLIEIGCAKKFLFEDDTLPNFDDIPNKPQQEQFDQELNHHEL